jgi:MoaA/NifB/PqqE/SkfB family radical SAM enzyme
MKTIREALRRFNARVQPLPAGVYAYQTPPEAPFPYRLHLRIEPDGSGLLIVNASTVLHLNQSAAEYAFHIVNSAPEEEVLAAMTARYRVNPDQIRRDFRDLKERIETLIHVPDLDPASFLEFERQDPYSSRLSAPLRLDCALTYRCNTGCTDGFDSRTAPIDRVRRELTTDEWITILNKAWGAGIPHVIFTGGEPTLRPDLPELIHHTENQGQVAGLISDGLRLAETAYLHQVLQSGLDHLMLVLDPGEYAAWEGLRDVLVEDLFTTVHVTITPDTVPQVNSLLERLAGMGVTSLSLSATHADLADALQAARQEAALLGLSLVWDLPVPYSALHPVALEVSAGAGNGEIPTGQGKVWLYVEPDGDVTPAQGDKRILGNLLEEPWEAVWKKASEVT